MTLSIESVQHGSVAGRILILTKHIPCTPFSQLVLESVLFPTAILPRAKQTIELLVKLQGPLQILAIHGRGHNQQSGGYTL
jgi:hypothetical protein